MSERALKYKPWRPSVWTRELPNQYLEKMTALVEKLTASWFSQQDIEDGYDAYVKARYIFGRMEIAHLELMPWIQASIPGLKQKNVLEIGCGNGSATVPLAMEAKFVRAMDIADDQVRIAAQRCNILSIENVDFFSRGVNWIDEYYNDPLSLAPSPDIIVCYALLEHLLPIERVKFLSGAWRHLQDGGYLIVIEAPNRLYWFDWHSSLMPFIDQLPHEIQFLWNSFSSRSSIPGDIKATSIEAALNGNVDRLYRFGRGVSFHEFHVALGVDAYKIVNGYTLDRAALLGFDLESIALLEKQLARVSPSVDAAFAQPSLDLVIKRTGPARLAPITAVPAPESLVSRAR